MDDHFSRLNLWLDAIDERQQHTLKISKNYFTDRWSLTLGNVIWSIMFTSHMSTMVGPTLHPIGGLVAPRPLLTFCRFSPLPLVFFSYMLHLIALGTMFLLSIGGELVLIGGLCWAFDQFVVACLGP